MNNKIYTCKNEHRYWLEIVPYSYVGVSLLLLFCGGFFYLYIMGGINLIACVVCSIIFAVAIIFSYYDQFTAKFIQEVQLNEENKELKCKYLFFKKKYNEYTFYQNQFRTFYKIGTFNIYDIKGTKLTLYPGTWDKEEWEELKLKLIEWSKEFDTNLFAEERYIKKSQVSE